MIKIVLDNFLLEKLRDDDRAREPFLAACRRRLGLDEAVPLQIIFPWASLLHYIGSSDLFERFPSFGTENALFRLIQNQIENGAANEILIDLYDLLFVECLTEVKALPEVSAAFLLQAMGAKSWPPLFSQAGIEWQRKLEENPKEVLHDLTLYLAWDRMCVRAAIIFEQAPCSDAALQGIETFKSCLIESFQHILGQKKSSPGFFRLMEALFAIEMRPERIDRHSDQEWAILSQGASLLRPREFLVDPLYICEVARTLNDGDRAVRATLDSEEKSVSARNLSAYFGAPLHLIAMDSFTP